MTKRLIISSINIWCPAEPVFIPSKWGFVPGCWLQKAFSLSWIIQWEHPVDGALGFETWAWYLTHTRNCGLQVVCGVAPVVSAAPPRSIPSPPPHFAALLVPKWEMLRPNLLAIKLSILQHSHYICCPSALIWRLQRLSNHHPRCVFVGHENHSVWGVQ